MNELYFLAQILFTVLFAYGALRLGKSALITAVALQALLANLLVLKQITLFGFVVTGSDTFAVGSILCLNLLREHHGLKEVKKAISTTFFFLLFFVVMANLHLKFAPSSFDTAHSAYERILTPAPRLLIASLLTFYLVQQLDSHLFGYISRLMPHSSFSTRSTLTLSASQLADTILFSFIGLLGLVAKFHHILLISFLIKCSVVLLIAPLTRFFQRFSYERY